MNGNGRRVEATVLLDGKPMPDDAQGTDTGPDGHLSVGAPWLYNLVTLSAGDL